MSGKFVPAGSHDQVTDRDKDWLQAQQELDTKQKEREKQKPEDAGKTLYEVLQANKAAKEEAFQESIKLKNQFRALNDDEIDFLDAQADAVRAREQAVRKDTVEQLRLFREKQDAASKTALASPDVLENESDAIVADLDTTWTTTRKRKRLNGKDSGKNTKLPRSVSDKTSSLDERSVEPANKENPSKGADPKPSHQNEPTVSAPAKKPGLSLVDYGSEEDSDS